MGHLMKRVGERRCRTKTTRNKKITDLKICDSSRHTGKKLFCTLKNLQFFYLPQIIFFLSLVVFVLHLLLCPTLFIKCPIYYFYHLYINFVPVSFQSQALSFNLRLIHKINGLGFMIILCYSYYYFLF